MIPCLLVAGDKQARDVIRIGLEQTGEFQIDVAEDAWALEMAKAKPYQAVFVDSQLADGTDGIELMEQLRDVLAGDAQLVLISRNRGEARYLTRDKQHLGIFAYVHVPVDPIEFFRTLGRLTERISGAPAA